LTRRRRRRLLLPTSGCSHPVDALSCEQAEEEALLSTSFTLLLDSDGAFRGLHKPGGAPLDEATTGESLAAARKRLPALVAASGAKRAGFRF